MFIRKTGLAIYYWVSYTAVIWLFILFWTKWCYVSFYLHFYSNFFTLYIKYENKVVIWLYSYFLNRHVSFTPIWCQIPLINKLTQTAKNIKFIYCSLSALFLLYSIQQKRLSFDNRNLLLFSNTKVLRNFIVNEDLIIEMCPKQAVMWISNSGAYIYCHMKLAIPLPSGHPVWQLQPVRSVWNIFLSY